jgi:hypothetical protein
MQRLAVLLVIAATSLGAVVSAGCAARRLEARAVLSPASKPPRLAIYTRNQDLPREYQLENTAEVQVRPSHGLSVTVRNVHPREAVADPSGWTVWIEDESGTQYQPTSRRDARLERLAIEWTLDEPLSVGANDAWRHRRMVRRNPGLDAYQGLAAYEFAWPHLVGAERLTLVVRRQDVTLRYVWRFAPGEESIQNLGRTESDLAAGVLTVPGEATRVAGGPMR